MFIDRWMDKEVAVHVYSEILLSHEKEWIWVSRSEVDEPLEPVTQSELSQKEKDWYHILMHMYEI